MPVKLDENVLTTEPAVYRSSKKQTRTVNSPVVPMARQTRPMTTVSSDSESRDNTSSAAPTWDPRTAVARVLELCDYVQVKMEDIKEAADLTGLDLPVKAAVKLATTKPAVNQPAKKPTKAANSPVVPMTRRTRPITPVTLESESRDGSSSAASTWEPTRAIASMLELCDYAQAKAEEIKEAANLTGLDKPVKAAMNLVTTKSAIKRSTKPTTRPAVNRSVKKPSELANTIAESTTTSVNILLKLVW